MLSSLGVAVLVTWHLVLASASSCLVTGFVVLNGCRRGGRCGGRVQVSDSGGHVVVVKVVVLHLCGHGGGRSGVRNP
jgi:hypothetical protein